VLDRYDVGGATATYSTYENLGISRPSRKQNDQGFVLKSIPNCAGDEPPPLDTMLQFARGLAT
jgi:hypothetical protein